MTKILNIYFKQNKKRLLLLIPENTADTVFIVRKTKMLTESREKRYKVFQELNISNISIFSINCQSTHSFWWI